VTRSLAPGDVVIVALNSPREKLWGVLLSTSPAGVIVRGLDLNGFDDWVHQEAGGEDRMVGPATIFLPMGRVERVERDERLGPVPSLSDRFRAKVGRGAAEALGWAAPSARRRGTRRPPARRG
jgi:hypothetical protein